MTVNSILILPLSYVTLLITYAHDLASDLASTWLSKAFASLFFAVMGFPFFKRLKVS